MKKVYGNRYNVIELPAFENVKMAFLTLDMESDHADLLDEPSYEGLEHIPELVAFFKAEGLPLTCFVQGTCLEAHPDQIRPLAALDVDFELHSYSHPGSRAKMNTKFEVERGKEAYRKFFGKDPIGYRAPLGIFDDSDYRILVSNGFKYDASIIPSFRPGVFNNIRKPTKPFLVEGSGIIEFPLGVFSNLIRVPLGLSYIRLFGKPFSYLIKTFSLPDFIVFGFHLHDIFRLSSSSRIPMDRYSYVDRLVFRRIYRPEIDGMLTLKEFIMALRKNGYKFGKLIDAYQTVSLPDCQAAGEAS